jgi:hypothetical protein
VIQGSKVPCRYSIVRLRLQLLQVFQYFFELLDPADATLAEVDLDVAGELVTHVQAQQFHELVELLYVLVLLFTHGSFRILRGD